MPWDLSIGEGPGIATSALTIPVHRSSVLGRQGCYWSVMLVVPLKVKNAPMLSFEKLWATGVSLVRSEPCEPRDC